VYRGAVPSRKPALEMRRPELKLLAVLGVPTEKIVYLDDQPVVFDELTVSSPPFWEKTVADRRFLDVHDRIRQVFEAHDPVGGQPVQRLYLSRTRLADRKRSALNEPEIEALMEARGFTIVHPQLLPIQRQIRLARSAEIIAGCDGSALHLAAFARPSTMLLAIDARAVPNQFTIDQARGLDALHVLATGSVLGNRSKRWAGDLGQISAGLDLLLLDDET
jgi:capsular polysaccharide biosynthesis protein